MARRYLGHEMLVVGPSIRTGMPIRIDNPREVGADRLVNAVAAYDRVRDTCVVVDFGTAITYDVVSAAGEYLGGIITPGAEISIDALYERAAKLPEGRAGRAAGADRQVDGRGDPLRDRVRVRRPGRRDRAPAARRARRRRPTVLATGGLARALVPAVRETIDEVDDLLTLTGLRLIWERNQPRSRGRPARRSARRRRPAGTGTSGVRATLAARISRPSAAAVAGLGSAHELVVGVEQRRASPRTRARRRSRRGRRRPAGPAPASPGRPRCRASWRSRPASRTRRRGRAAGAGRGRARRPPARPAAAARRRRSAATARRRSSGSASRESPTWSAERSWVTADISVWP